MADPLVSVVMPTYNHAHFIKEAIDSVLNQSYAHIELIIIDNYSEDETEQIINGYADDRVKYFKFANKGIIAASRNHGIGQARGKYVAFIDSDDIWLEDKLKHQLNPLEDDEEIGLSFCSFSVISENPVNNNLVRSPKTQGIEGHVYAQLINSNFIISSSALVRSSCLKEIGMFDESPDLYSVEDYDLWLRIARIYQIVHIPEVLGVYREHELNGSAQVHKMEKITSLIHKHLNLGWITQEQANRAQANYYFHVGWPLIDLKPKTARSYFSKACRLIGFNLKIIFACSVGYLLTFLPSLFRFVRNRRLDKRVARKIMNPQNL